MSLPTSPSGQTDKTTTSGMVLKLKNFHTENSAGTLTEQTFLEQIAGSVVSSEGLQEPYFKTGNRDINQHFGSQPLNNWLIWSIALIPTKPANAGPTANFASLSSSLRYHEQSSFSSTEKERMRTRLLICSFLCSIPGRVSVSLSAPRGKLQKQMCKFQWLPIRLHQDNK